MELVTLCSHLFFFLSFIVAERSNVVIIVLLHSNTENMSLTFVTCNRPEFLFCCLHVELRNRPTDLCRKFTLV
jgi:hypothetical protein